MFEFFMTSQTHKNVTSLCKKTCIFVTIFTNQMVTCEKSPESFVFSGEPNNIHNKINIYRFVYLKGHSSFYYTLFAEKGIKAGHVKL